MSEKYTNAVSSRLMSKAEFHVPTFASAKKAALEVIRTEVEKSPLAELRKEEEEILAKAVEVQQRMVGSVVSYFELCAMLRKARLVPKVGKALLYAAGFNKVRVSEILTVVGTSEAVFKEYMDRAISFRLALDKARNEKRNLEPVPALPEKWRPVFHDAVSDLLKDRRRAILEVDGVRIVMTRSRPKQVEMDLEPDKVAPESSKTKKKGKK